MTNNKKPTLLTLPPEIRNAIYFHLFSDLSLLIAKDSTTGNGNLDTSNYPYQITATSRLLRDETTVLLRRSNNTTSLALRCEHGRFPDSIRQKLPRHVFQSIRSIVILKGPCHDDLKPKLSTFPNLQLLYFDICFTTKVIRDPASSLVISDLGRETPEYDSQMASRYVMRWLSSLHTEQEQPREGLERDYIPDATLWDVVRKGRKRRGFAVAGRAKLTARILSDDPSICANKALGYVDLDLEIA